MIAPFYKADQLPRDLEKTVPASHFSCGNLFLGSHSYAVGDFGRLPLLLPERGALNLKAFAPGWLSLMARGFLFPDPWSWPGVFISAPSSVAAV